jgi:hypothetical protein
MYKTKENSYTAYVRIFDEVKTGKGPLDSQLLMRGALKMTSHPGGVQRRGAENTAYHTVTPPSGG